MGIALLFGKPSGDEGDGKEEAGGDYSSKALDSAVDEMFAAIKSGDKGAFKTALKAAVKTCSMDSGGEPDEDDAADEEAPPKKATKLSELFGK